MHDRKSNGCEQRFLSSLTEQKEKGISVSQGKQKQQTDKNEGRKGRRKKNMKERKKERKNK